MTTYTLTITESQARVISVACEILARLGLGQFRDALDHLPQREDIDWSIWHDDMEIIGNLLSRHMLGGVDGWRSNLGIHHQDVSEQSRIAWDLHQVVRHRLAWDRAIAYGHTDGTTRNWDEMISVYYDDPSHVSDEPLAKIDSAIAKATGADHA